MRLMQEYRKQGHEYRKQFIYISLGLAVLLFPFVHNSYLLSAFLVCALIFSMLPPDSRAFAILARESDVKAGKLLDLMYLFFTMSFLLFLGLVFGDRLPLFIIAGAFVITTFGDGIADIVNIYEKSKKGDQNDTKVYSAKSSITFLVSGSVFASLAGAWISDFTHYVPYELIFFLAVLGAITGALLESITWTEDYITIPFGSAMTMWLFYTFSLNNVYNVDIIYLIEVLTFAFVLGFLAYKARIADISAMLSATLLGVVIIVSGGIEWYFILLMFFLLGGVFTRYKYSYKLAHGTAEKKGGVRGYKNVFSNSLAALSLAIAYRVFPPSGQLLLCGYLGSIATATGDTLASEIGQTYRGEPRMITTLRKARTGTDGAVSGLGELAALFGAGIIALLSYRFIQSDVGLAIAVLSGGFIGTNIDSVFGATLQQKGYLSNNGVNLFATIFGALISVIVYSAGS